MTVGRALVVAAFLVFTGCGLSFGWPAWAVISAFVVAALVALGVA